MKPPTPLEWAYFAGLVDGEGSLFVQQRPYSFKSELEITNTHKPTLEWIQARFGGSLKPRAQRNNHWKPYYRWRVVSNPMLAPLLRNVLPFLVTKRRQAEIMLELIETIQATRPTLQVRRRRQWLFAELKRANQKGLTKPRALG